MGMCRGRIVFAVWLCASVPLVSQAAWQNVPIPAGLQYARVLCDTEQYLYGAFETAAGAPGGLYRTPSLTPGAWEYLGFNGIRVYDVVDAAGGGSVLLVGTNDADQVYRSTDQGATWSPCGTALPGGQVRSLHWDGGSPGRVYCAILGGSDQYLSVSTDLGVSWTTLYNAGVSNSPLILSSRGNGSPTIWHTLYDGYWTTPTYRSTNGGETWALLPGYSLDGPPTALCTPSGSPWIYSLIDGVHVSRWKDDAPETSWSLGFYGADMETPAWWNGRLVACGVAADGHLSVAQRAESEGVWTPMNDGLPDDTSPSPDGAWWRFVLESGVSRPVLYYGTWTLGLWMSDMSNIVGVEETVTLRTGPSLRIAPNPACAMVRLSADDVVGDPVEWKIVDAAGRQVASLRGGKEETWDLKDAMGRSVPCGTYYVSMHSGSGAASARLLLVR
jgi:hypothetical protein